MDVKSMTLNYDGSEYLQNKSITADLQTKMNLKTLGFNFERNDLKINQLPVKFTGYFEFIDKGYDMSFKINSELVPFRSLFTALPKEYLTWMEDTKIEGKAQLQVSLNGKYIYEQNIAPDVLDNIDTITKEVKLKLLADQSAITINTF
jgi:AsmA protein